MAAITAREADIQRTCLDYLALKRYFFFRLNNIPVSKDGEFRRLSIYTPRGLPDAVVVHEGRFIGIEFKREDGKPSHEQVECAQRILKAGGDYHIVRSLDDLVKIGL